MNVVWLLLANLQPDPPLAPVSDPVGLDALFVNLGGNDLPAELAAATGADADQELYERLRFVLTAWALDLARAWARAEFRPPDWTTVPDYSYSPLIAYNLVHERAFGPPASYFYRSLAHEAAMDVGPFPDKIGPLPVDTLSSQYDKTLPGVFAPGVDPDPARSYVDPRRFTRDGVHPNPLGAAHLADQILRLLAFPELGIPRAVLRFDSVVEDGRVVVCPSATVYPTPASPPPSGPESGGPEPGEDVSSGEEAASGEWGVSDQGLTTDEGT